MLILSHYLKPIIDPNLGLIEELAGVDLQLRLEHVTISILNILICVKFKILCGYLTMGNSNRNICYIVNSLSSHMTLKR